MSFIEWKKSYQKDRVCRNERSVRHWLALRGKKIIPELKKTGWVCKERERIYLIKYKLFLNVEGFDKKYELKILSLCDTNRLIYDAYFNIFGNICTILNKHVRIMEYPYGNLILQKFSIWATVKPLWIQERSGYKITRFLKKYCQEKRNSITGIEKINHKKLPSVVKPRGSQGEKCVQEKERTVDASWSTKQYHKKIVQYFVQGKSKYIKKPRLMLIFGLPGSGKNWVLEKKRGQNHVIINVDDCRALLPHYWKNMLEKNHKEEEDWIRLFHSECSIIAQSIFEYAIKHRMNIIWNGTGKNLKKYRTLMSRAKCKGYTIELRYIWVPLELALTRVHRRASIIGRAVPDEVVHIANKKIPETFKKLRINTDYARIYSNNSISPTMVWDKDQGWHDYTPRRRKSIGETIL